MKCDRLFSFFFFNLVVLVASWKENYYIVSFSLCLCLRLSVYLSLSLSLTHTSFDSGFRVQVFYKVWFYLWDAK